VIRMERVRTESELMSVVVVLSLAGEAFLAILDGILLILLAQALSEGHTPKGALVVW